MGHCFGMDFRTYGMEWDRYCVSLGGVSAKTAKGKQRYWVGGVVEVKLLQWAAGGHVACATLDLKKHLFFCGGSR